MITYTYSVTQLNLMIFLSIYDTYIRFVFCVAASFRRKSGENLSPPSKKRKRKKKYIYNYVVSLYRRRVLVLVIVSCHNSHAL